MLRDPAILLLDEATSALDVATEAAINSTLAQLARGRTVIAVAHRLASVGQSDRIFVLNHGQLVEQGRHPVLLARGGVYTQLWSKQSGFAISEDGTSARVDAARLRALPLLAALQDDMVGRVLDRLYDTDTMKVCTACAVRADRNFGFDKRYVHFDTTLITVHGDYRPPEEAEESEVPFRITQSYSKDKRSADPRGTGSNCPWSFARRESWSPVAHSGGSEMGCAMYGQL